MPGFARLNRFTCAGSTRAAALALGVLLLQAPAAQAVAVQAQAPALPAATAPSAHKAAPARTAQAPTRPTDTRPGWAELTPEQQQALQPLAGSWPTLSEAQKRKWIALSRNFRQMKPDEQSKLHS